MNLDRFESGFKDPQEDEPEIVAVCSNIKCNSPIYAGEDVLKDYDDMYFCDSDCYAKASDVEWVTA